MRILESFLNRSGEAILGLGDFSSDLEDPQHAGLQSANTMTPSDLSLCSPSYLRADLTMANIFRLNRFHRLAVLRQQVQPATVIAGE